MSRNKFLRAKCVTLNIFQKWGTTNIRHSVAKFIKLRVTARTHSTAVAWLSSCLYTVLAVDMRRGWSVERQSKRLIFSQNNNKPTYIWYTVCVETVLLLFVIPEPLKTKQNYTSQNTWNRTPNSGSSQQRMQNYSGVQKLMFW